jgi:hypothetical protein
MQARVGSTIGALLVLASCSSDSQVTPTPTAPPREPGRVLTLTLTQGENLSGPYGGTVTGPNGFTCTLKQSDQSQSCPSAQFSDGQTISLQVTLTNAVPGDKPIWRTFGCDSVTASACTLTMTADRSVTISIGCAIC